jgi:predicted nucleotidyltransferase
MNQEKKEKKNGMFEAYINSRASRVTAQDRALMKAVTQIVRAVIPSAQLRWAGSQRKGTAIIGSDLDVVVESHDPVTEALRRTLRAELETQMKRQALVLSHAVRLPAYDDAQKMDIAFANAAFGSRNRSRGEGGREEGLG